MTVKKEATGKVTFMLNSNICSKSTTKRKTFLVLDVLPIRQILIKFNSYCSEAERTFEYFFSIKDVFKLGKLANDRTELTITFYPFSNFKCHPLVNRIT